MKTPGLSVYARRLDEPMTPDQIDEDMLAEAEVWDKPNPVKKHRHLSPARKAAAKARAKRAGRKYPNMIDNIWAARK
jgi:hypothetical protein